MKEDTELKAPPGWFRVTGWDTFPAPSEPVWIGDFSGLDRAQEIAWKHTKPFFDCVVYDDQGTMVWPPEEIGFMARVRAANALFSSKH
jgi:hypothetical protein